MEGQASTPTEGKAMATYSFTLVTGETFTRRSKAKAFPYVVVMTFSDPNNGAPMHHVSFASSLERAEREARTVRKVCSDYLNLAVTVQPTAVTG